MRFTTLALVLAVAALAQRDPFAGVYQGEKVTLELKGAAGKYSGTLTVLSQSFPVSVVANGTSASGSFTAGGMNYPFTLTPYGNGYKLASDGVEYPLVRRDDTASAPPPSPPPPPPPPPARGIPVPAGATAGGSIVGTWRNGQGSATFNADGTGTMDGQSGRYQTSGDRLTLIGAQGQLTLQYAIAGDQLTLRGSGGAIVLDRVKQESGPGSVHLELVGKWCWISVVSAQQGARQSNRCITLNGNGTYAYAGMTDSYNPYGGATSQSSDSGTWTATETTLTARSASGRVTVYQLEKRNHPKNRDPMIVLNGDAFVTFYNKPPW